jgi:hypothetical protein
VRQGGAVDIKTLIPAKFFEFDNLGAYQSGIAPPITRLTVVRDRLISILPSDLSDKRILPRKASYYHAVFAALRDLENVKITETRKDNLAEKRHEKRNNSRRMGPLSTEVSPVWVGPPAPPLSEDDVRRIASISDPLQSSAGSQLFHATQEKESELLGNLFCQTTLDVLFVDPSLDWVTGRTEIPILQWQHGYPLNPFIYLLVPSQRK